jgi:hypothetical protein
MQGSSGDDFDSEQGTEELNSFSSGDEPDEEGEQPVPPHNPAEDEEAIAQAMQEYMRVRRGQGL